MEYDSDHSPGADARNNPTPGKNDSDSDNLSFNADDYESMDGRQMVRCSSVETVRGSLDSGPKKVDPKPQIEKKVDKKIREVQAFLHRARSTEEFVDIIKVVTGVLVSRLFALSELDIYAEITKFVLMKGTWNKAKDTLQDNEHFCKAHHRANPILDGANVSAILLRCSS